MSFTESDPPLRVGQPADDPQSTQLQSPPQFGLSMISLFSGAGGLDVGLALAGLRATVVLDNDPDSIATLRASQAALIRATDDHVILDGARIIGASVDDVSAADLRPVGAPESWCPDLLAGGPPCQAFSPGGNRAGLNDPRGNLIYTYFRFVRDLRPRFFLFENVANLVTAALNHRPIAERPGQHWSLRAYEHNRTLGGSAGHAMRDDELSGSAIRSLLRDIRELGYKFTFGVVNAADYGAPQHRLRFLMIGARDGAPPRLPTPTHGPNGSGLRPWATLRDAIWDLRDDPGQHYVYTPAFARLFRLVPPGGCWRDLALADQKAALGNAYESGGGKTGFFRRLAWDAPAPTITGKPNRKGAALCHPEQIRPLSLRECTRLQGFPDAWRFMGSNDARYRQVGNAVPVQLATAVGRAIMAGDTASADDMDADRCLHAAIARLRAAGRNKRSDGAAGQIGLKFAEALDDS